MTDILIMFIDTDCHSIRFISPFEVHIERIFTIQRTIFFFFFFSSSPSFFILLFLKFLRADSTIVSSFKKPPVFLDLSNLGYTSSTVTDRLGSTNSWSLISVSTPGSLFRTPEFFRSRLQPSFLGTVFRS